jgi:hypothetical protein
MFGLTLVVLIGFAGLAIDLGRFFVIKAELQNAMDACALSAASQLRPGTNDAKTLERAAAYGRVFFKTGVNDAVKNKVNFQSIVPSPEITFAASNSGPFSELNVADPKTAKYVKCQYPYEKLPIYFMQVLNPLLTTQTVSAMAVAKRDRPIAPCIPVAVCSAEGGTVSNGFGHSEGDWITAFDGKQYGTGNFGWIDFSPPTGGDSEIKAILAGGKQCDVSQIGETVGQTGKQDTLQEAWNTRFGWYRQGGGYDPGDAPPDKTGFAYSNLNEDGSEGGGNWPSGSNAYADFEAAQATFQPYQQTIPLGIQKNQYGQPLQSPQLDTLGRFNRRVVVAPVVNCTTWNTPPGSQTPSILGWACVLMLNPINGGSAASNIAKLEFLGLTSDAGNPCGEQNSMAPVLTQ